MRKPEKFFADVFFNHERPERREKRREFEPEDTEGRGAEKLKLEKWVDGRTRHCPRWRRRPRLRVVAASRRHRH